MHYYNPACVCHCWHIIFNTFWQNIVHRDYTAQQIEHKGIQRAEALAELRLFDRFDVCILKYKQGNVVDSICLATRYRYFI